MINYFLALFLSSPTAFNLFIDYPSYQISFILSVLLIYKFRVTGIVLLLHSIIFYIYFHPGVRTDKIILDSSEFSSFDPNIWTVPISGLILIPIIILFGIVIELKLINQKTSSDDYNDS